MTGDRGENTPLLVALGELAAEVQRARTQAEILAGVAAGLSRLGYGVSVMRLEGARGAIVRSAAPGETILAIQRLLGRRLEGLSFPLAPIVGLETAIHEHRPLHHDDAAPFLAAFFAAAGVYHPETARRCAELLGGKLAMLPLRVGDLPWGALVVASPSLGAADVAAFRLFAAQVSASLEVADSLEFLARKNRELGTVDELVRAEAPSPATGADPAAATRRIRYLETLWDLGRAGSEARAVAPLVSRVLERLNETLAIDAAAIHAVEDDRLVLAGPRFGAWDPVTEEEMRVLPLDGRELPGLAVAERRTVTELLPGQRLPGSLAERLGVPHSVTVPLLASDRVVGTLSVVRRGEATFTPEEVQLLEICSAQVAVALENAGLFEQKRRRVRDLSLLNELSGVLSSQLELPAVLETGVRFLERMFEDVNVFFVLRFPDGEYRVAASSVGEELSRDLRFPLDRPSVVREAIRSNRPVIVDEVTEDVRAAREIAARFGHRSLLAVPLVSRSRPIGALILGDPHRIRRFRRLEVDRVTPMAAAIAAAVVNAWLFETERRRAEQARLLLDVGRTITASLELERILETSAGALAQMIEAANAHIFLLDAGSRTLRGAATSVTRHRALIRGSTVALEEPSAASRAVLERRPVMIPDVSVPSTARLRKLALDLGEKSILALPLLVRDEPIGAVVIGDVHGPRTWTGAEIERASLVAHQMAVAVANAKLFEDLRRSYAELARTQEELVKRERLAALGELSAVVAHEVRNPLGVIFNALGPLRRLLQPTGDARMLLDIVGEEADRLNRIVSDLLDFARPHEPSLERASLGGLLAELLDAVRADPAAAQVRLEAKVAADLPPVRIDARMIRQALLNVVQNAVQAMPKGGAIHVTARREDRDGRPWAAVAVADEGPGIPAGLAARVFQPFFTTKATGTGLGLAVVKRIIEAHRGEVEVMSPPGGGTTFTVRLPIHEAS